MLGKCSEGQTKNPKEKKLEKEETQKGGETKKRLEITYPWKEKRSKGADLLSWIGSKKSSREKTRKPSNKNYVGASCTNLKKGSGGPVGRKNGKKDTLKSCVWGLYLCRP